MTDKDDYKGDSPRRDFYRALTWMLDCYDQLEQEDIPLMDYPHYEFVNHFTKRTEELFKKGEMTPFAIACIPFEIVKESTISKSKQEQNKEYIEVLLSQYRENTNDSIYEHLVSLKKLEDGSRIFEFEDKVKYPNWSGWRPSDWSTLPKEWDEHKEEYENIGKEFEFAYSVARFYHLCLKQMDLDPAKKICLEYFLNLKRDAEILAQSNDDAALADLKKYLTRDFSEDLSIKKLQDNIKYFSPYYLTDLEMNTFFEWSICLCSEKPNLPFFKEIWLLGKLYHVNVFPLAFFKNDNSKINTPLLLKIRAFKESLLKNNITFPPEEKIKSVNENWDKSIVWLVRGPFKDLFPAFCDLQRYASQCKGENDEKDKDIIEKNKVTIEKAKSKVHPYLDWIDLDLDRPTDKNHRIFAAVIKALCLFSGNPKFYTNLLTNKKEQFLPLLDNLFKQNDGNTDNLPVLVPLNNVDDSLSPYIFILIGLFERILYPIVYPLRGTPEFLQQLKSLQECIELPGILRVLEFRSNAILGKVFSHPKITCFATVYDFGIKISFLKETSRISEEINSLIEKENEKNRNETKKKLLSIDVNALDEYHRKELDKVKDSIAEGERISEMQRITLNMREQFRLQVQKKDLENH